MPKRTCLVSTAYRLAPVNGRELALADQFYNFDTAGLGELLDGPRSMSYDDIRLFYANQREADPYPEVRATYRNWCLQHDAFKASLRSVPLDTFLTSPVRLTPALITPCRFLFDERNEHLLDKAVDAYHERLPMRWPIRREVLFGRHFWSLSDAEEFYDDEQLRLVFLDTVDKERRKFEKLKLRHSGLGGAAIRTRREAIPKPVRMYVWRRDEGKCVRCGSAERLEFDHVIPHSRGGSDTERNIQLLCEPCNRQKSDDV